MMFAFLRDGVFNDVDLKKLLKSFNEGEDIVGLKFYGNSKIMEDSLKIIKAWKYNNRVCLRYSYKLGHLRAKRSDVGFYNYQLKDKDK